MEKSHNSDEIQAGLSMKQTRNLTYKLDIRHSNIIHIQILRKTFFEIDTSTMKFMKTS